MIILINAEVFDKIQHPFMIKTLNKLDIEIICVNIIKTVYDKHTANIILTGKRLNAFFSKTRNKTRVPTLTTPIQHSMEVVTKQIS